jgi:hypothetical protein
MLENHLRAVPCLKRHLRRVRHRRQPVTDIAVTETIILPGERFPPLDLLKQWCPRQDLNLFDRYMSFRDSVNHPINRGDFALLQNSPHTLFCALMQFSCQ